MELKRENIKTKPFCLRCDIIGEYELTTEIRKVAVKGVQIEYEAIKTYCPHCGEPLFLYEAERINEVRCFDEYKRKKGLLTSEEMINIRNKYGLSQTDLAKAIMVGKKNIARYETGKIQDKSIDLLIRLLDKHPYWFGIKEEIPNKKTLKAFREVEKMKQGKKKSKTYTLDELRKELDVKTMRK